jgi:hypothetical protein
LLRLRESGKAAKKDEAQAEQDRARGAAESDACGAGGEFVARVHSGEMHGSYSIACQKILPEIPKRDGACSRMEQVAARMGSLPGGGSEKTAATMD